MDKLKAAITEAEKALKQGKHFGYKRELLSLETIEVLLACAQKLTKDPIS